ncbi:MAG: hypothetical protein K2K24_05055, partial [Clostridia bacterium]|nr:hypothetical protein [Clostridia bacterium]
MKKSKLITTLLLVVVLLIAMLSVFAACDPTEKNNEKKDPSEIKVPIIPPDPTPPDDPVTHYTTMEVFQKAVGSIETPEQVLGLDFGIDFMAPDGKKTEIALKGNLYSKYHNELAFTIYQSLANQDNKERIFGIYMIDDKMYVDLGEDKAMLYLEDINPNYVVQLAEGGIGMLGGLLDQYGSTISGFLDLIFLFLFKGDPVIEVTEDGGENITMVFDVKGLLRDVPEILELLAGAISLPVDLGPFVAYLSDLMPEGEYKVLVNFDADDNLTYLGVDIDNSAKNELTSLELKIDITDSKVEIPEIENVDLSDIKNFSLTNIQFSIDLQVGTQKEWVKDSEGNIVEKDKQLDVGIVVNDIMSLIGNSDVNFPRGLLLLEGGTGLRLSFAIDLDLNYKKERDENGALVDNNKIAIELFLLDRNGNLADGEGSRPQAGIYYSQGSLYVNLDNLLPNYLQNINLRVDANLNTLISALVDMITNAIDGALGTDFQDIINYTYDESGAVVLSSAQDFERVLSTADADVLTYSLDENGNYVIAAGFKEFVSQLAGLVGFNQVIKIDGSKIVITANDEMIMAIESLIGKELGFRFPEMIPEINLTI